MDFIRYQPIGIVRTPFLEQAGTPIQPRRGRGIAGTVEIFPEFADGLSDLEGFSHIYLIYHLHRSEGFDLRVIPYLDDVPRGVFATRAPARPNPIGVSVVRLRKIEGAVLHIEDLDILDGTPLLDIKPYAPDFDHVEEFRIGWLEGKTGRVPSTDADGRFDPSP
jgi:tRNA-Thr(GGU) m(6)t(6)A37 methyltransferase TsaA